MNWKRGLGFVLFLAGAFFFINSGLGITGFVIAESINVSVSFLLGLVLIIGGIVLILSGIEDKVNINGIAYDSHAVKRMEDRNLFPMIIKDALENGEHYKFTGEKDMPEYEGATDIYVRRDSAVLAPGKIGKRGYKEMGENRKKKDASIIVLTDENGVVKTTFTKYGGPLDNFLKKYSSKVDEGREAA